jgi:predicted amidohydrolase
MKVSIIQQDISWSDVAENIRKADAAVDSDPGADLYVLPEMFSTGFCTSPEGIAEGPEGESLRWMKEKAAGTNAAIAGSVAVCEDGRYFNRFYFVKPDGSIETSLSVKLTQLLSDYQWAIVGDAVESSKENLKIELNDYGKSIDLVAMQ